VAESSIIKAMSTKKGQEQSRKTPKSPHRETSEGSEQELLHTHSMLKALRIDTLGGSQGTTVLEKVIFSTFLLYNDTLKDRMALQ